MNTGNKPANPHCTLGAFIPETMDVEALKRDGWNDHKILVVREDDSRLSWIERQIVQGIGEKLYRDRRGARNG